MKEFILLIRVPASYTGEQAKEVTPKWNAVTEKWKSENIFVTSFVFPAESYVLSGTNRAAKKEFVISDNLKVASTIVLLAENMEAAIDLSKACPILDYGGT